MRPPLSNATFINAERVHPKGPTEIELLRSTAKTAARDFSCPACLHAKLAWVHDTEEPRRAGITADGRLPQPACGGVTVMKELNAPLFMAAERPRRLLAEKAPFGLYMGGKSEVQR